MCEVGVHRNADAVMLGQQVCMLGGGNRTHHLGLERVGHAGPCKESRAAVGQLDDDVRLGLGSRLHHGIHAVGANHVDSGQRVTTGFGGFNHRLVAFAGNDTRLH
jgi:hypothetical protein